MPLLRAGTACGIVFVLGVKKGEYMRIIFCVLIALVALETNASECKNGKCPVRTVTKGTVQTVTNVTKGTIRVVTPPYTGRCKNGKCGLK